ncbi:MAG: hypothetical protein QOH05_860, partial [Acetobacteraceae bacterium]|nr:hypothetical protein [Acetobacteraceae bacterium]
HAFFCQTKGVDAGLRGMTKWVRSQWVNASGGIQLSSTVLIFVASPT